MTCQQEVLENIQRLWGTDSSEWTDYDHKFDLNNDNHINIQDSVLFGQMTEKECCNLLGKKYAGDTVTFTPENVNPGLGNTVTEYLWKYDETLYTRLPASPNLVIANVTAGTHNIEVKVVNSCGAISLIRTTTFTVIPPEGPGFDITVNIPGLLPSQDLHLRHVVKIPFTNRWIPPVLPPLIGKRIEWNDISNGLYKARQEEANCSPTPDTFSGHALNVGEHYAIQVGDQLLFQYFTEDVFDVEELPVAVTITKQSIPPEWLFKLCGFFDVSAGDCIASFYNVIPDIVFSAEDLSIIIEGKSIYPPYESKTPTKWHYICAGLTFIPFGGVVKGAGKAGVKVVKSSKLYPDVAQLFIKDKLWTSALYPEKKIHFLEVMWDLTEEHLIEVIGQMEKGNLNEADILITRYLPLDFHQSSVKSLGLYTKNLFERLLPGQPSTLIKQSGLEASFTGVPGKEIFKKGNILPETKNIIDEIFTKVPAAKVGLVDESGDILKNIDATPEMIERVVNAADNYPSIIEDLGTKTSLEDTGRMIVNAAQKVGTEETTKLNRMLFANSLKQTLESTTPIIFSGPETTAIRNIIESNPQVFYDTLDTFSTPFVIKFIKSFDSSELANLTTKLITSEKPPLQITGFCMNVMDDIKTIEDAGNIIPDITKTARTAIDDIAPKIYDDVVEGTVDFNIRSGPITEAMGIKLADNIVDDLDQIVDIPTATWRDKAGYYLKRKYTLMKFWVEDNPKSALGIGILAIWFLVDNVPFFIWIYLTATGRAPGDRSWQGKSHIDIIDQYKFNVIAAEQSSEWVLFCENLLSWENEVDNFEEFIELNRSTLENEKTYEIYVSTIEVYRLAIELKNEVHTCELDVLLEEFTAKVTNIVDGDTVDIDYLDKIRRVRLLGINTPEGSSLDYLIRRKTCPACDEERWNANKALYDKINEWATTNMWHKDLVFKSDQARQYDGTNRLLAVPYDGTTNLCKKELALGYAVVFFYDDNKQVNTTEFLASEKIAKDAKIGVWSIPIEYGSIKCISHPTNSEVWLDEDYTGHNTSSSTYTLEKVSIGSHTITFKKYIDDVLNICSKTVTVKLNEEVTAECTLTGGVVPPPPPPPTEDAIWNIGAVKNEAGETLGAAKIWVDGIYTGHYADEILTFCADCTCDTVIPCGFGEHTVTITRTGYADWNKTRTLAAGDVFTDNPVMLPPTFPITIESTPTGATIKVDGELQTISISRIGGLNLIEQILKEYPVTEPTTSEIFLRKLNRLR